MNDRSISKILTFDAKELRSKCGDCDEQHARVIVGQLKLAMRHCNASGGAGPGLEAVGLTAPQIGILKRVFIMRDPDPPIGSAGTGSGGILAFINPYYVRKLGAGGIGKKKETEHCLSYPGISCEVERYAACELVYRDENWNVCQRQFSTFDARIVQHEMDHLDGVCRVGDFWRASQPPASSVPKKATVLA